MASKQCWTEGKKMAQDPYGWWLPLNASAHAQEVDRLIVYLHVFMASLFVGWAIYFFYCLIRFRARENPRARTETRSFNFPLYIELLVVGVEVVLFVFLSSPFWLKLKTKFPKEAEALIVHVIAEQYAWNFHYPGRDGKFGRTVLEKVDSSNPIGLDRDDRSGKDDIATINVFHMPVNQKIIVYLSSKDVIHSFFLPVLRVKQDAIPGEVISIWFEAKAPGAFEVACAQLCGLGHYRMKGQLFIDTPDQFNAWLSEEEKTLESQSTAQIENRRRPHG